MDITKCNATDSECSKRSQCYRYTAISNKLYQSYSSFKMMDGKCDMFLSIDEIRNAQSRRYTGV